MNSVIFSGVVSVAVAMLTFLLQGLIKENRRLKHERETTLQNKQKALSEGVLCLLRNTLIELHDKYRASNSITRNAYENWLAMYKAYKALGGNGMVEHLKEDIEEFELVN